MGKGARLIVEAASFEMTKTMAVIVLIGTNFSTACFRQKDLRAFAIPSPIPLVLPVINTVLFFIRIAPQIVARAQRKSKKFYQASYNSKKRVTAAVPKIGWTKRLLY